MGAPSPSWDGSGSSGYSPSLSNNPSRNPSGFSLSRGVEAFPVEGVGRDEGSGGRLSLPGVPHHIHGARSFRNGQQSLDGKQLDRAHEDGARMSEVSELILEIIAPLFAMEEVVP